MACRRSGFASRRAVAPALRPAVRDRTRRLKVATSGSIRGFEGAGGLEREAVL